MGDCGLPPFCEDALKFNVFSVLFITLAKIHHDRDDWSKVLHFAGLAKDCAQACKQDTIAARLFLSKAHHALGHSCDALSVLEELLVLEPKNEHAAALLQKFGCEASQVTG